MKLDYFPDTDTLYINLSDELVQDSEAYSDSLMVDFDEQGKPVGITIEHYSQSVSSQDIEIDLPKDAPFQALVSELG